MPVLKIKDQGHAAKAVAFNFEDMTARAQKYLDQVKAEAAQIMARTEKQAEEIRRKAERDGQAAAMKKVEAMIDQKVGEQMKSVLPALRQAVAEVQQTRQTWLGHWEKSAVHLATQIAARVIRREVAHAPEITLELVREALELAAGSPEIRVLLHPEDHEALAGGVRTLAAELGALAPVKVLSDPKISRGGCRLETCHGAIDQQFEAQLARIEQELT